MSLMLGHLWWYLSLAVSAVIVEEASPLIGGLRSRTGHLHFTFVVLFIAAGNWLCCMALYQLGRWRGHWVRKRFPGMRRFLLVAFRIVRRHPWRASLLVRYAYGLRSALPIACGAARVPVTLYGVGTAISSLTWALIFTLLGWAFGESARRVMGHLHRYETRLALIIVVVLLIVYLVMRRKHVENEVVVVLASGDPGPVPKLTE